jgi:hypothetical protein
MDTAEITKAIQAISNSLHFGLEDTRSPINDLARSLKGIEHIMLLRLAMDAKRENFKLPRHIESEIKELF